ncbi:MAG: hypothetical protein WBM78_18195, partial [Desulfobacterales bacterium]
LGSRQEIITQDCAGFWFVYKAHPPAHIGICVGGCNAVDGPKNKQDVYLFLAATLKAGPVKALPPELNFNHIHLHLPHASYGLKGSIK